MQNGTSKRSLRASTRHRQRHQPECDTYIVPSQLSTLIFANAQTQAYNEAVQQKGRGHGLGPPFIWALGVSDSRALLGRDAAGRVAGTSVGSLGRAEQIVDRGQVQGVQALSSRENFPANAVQSHARSSGAVSAFGGGNAAGRTKARTFSSDGTGTRAPRLVGDHEEKGATSAREFMPETSKFLAARGVDPRSERWRIMMASHATQQQAQCCSEECLGQR